MKKFLHLLVVAALAVPGGVNAQEPKVYPGGAFCGISPNGNYAVSDRYGYVNIYNLVTGEKAFDEDEEGFAFGNGNCISNTGVIVGNNAIMVTAGYWKNAQWHDIESVAGRAMSKADGITPDGSRIVGAVAPENFEGIDGLMLTPCYWDVQADGTLGDLQLLPYPEKDLTNRTPQYITAISVSDDGKTIAGQIQDYSGRICQPIIYRQDEEGKWSYTLIHDDLYHPEGLVLPEYPGEYEGEDPFPYDYFSSEEESEAYNEAWNNWYDSGHNPEEEPLPEDFMSDESKKAAFLAIAIPYREWEKKWNAFAEALDELVSLVPVLEFNNVFLSHDGKIYASTTAKEVFDPMAWWPVHEYAPCVFNLEDNTYKTYPNDGMNLILTSMADDGTLLAQKPASEEPASAYILPAGAEKFVSLYDYFTTANATLAEWIKENMTHEYEAYDMDTWEPYTAEALVTGIPFTNADMSVIVTAVENFWFDWDNGDYDTYVDVYGYVLPTGMSTSITNATKDKVGAQVFGQKGGMLQFKGEVANATVYNMNGGKVYAVEAPAATVATGLGAGVYVVKVVATNGTVTFAKVAL